MCTVIQFCRKVYKYVVNIMVLQDKAVYSFKKFRKHIPQHYFIQPFPLQTNTNRPHKFIYRKLYSISKISSFAAVLFVC